MSETRKIAAILVSDVVGYSRLAGADEDRTLSRLRGLRSDLIDPAIAAHHGRVVKRTGDGALVEFRSVVDAVRCAIEVQNAHGRAQRRRARGAPHRLSDRHSSRRRGRGERRRPDGRRRQHRGALGRHRRAGRDLSVRGRLSAGEGAARSRRHRPRRDAAQEHRRADPGLFVASRRAGGGEAGDAAEAARAEETIDAGAARRRDRRARRGRGRRVVFPRSGTAPAPAAHLSIVVLPFTNLSNDPAQDYFADGVTENLTTDLSRIRGSFVIARNTAFTFKGKGLDAKEIGKELGVRYVLEGSVQRDGTRVRVNAQLIDAQSGAHLWADRFEEDVADLFKLQDQVVARLANSLGNELVKAEAEKGGRSQNPDAIDLAMRGRALLLRTAAHEGQQRRGARLVRTGARDRPEQCRCAGGRRLYLYRSTLYADGQIRRPITMRK